MKILPNTVILLHDVDNPEWLDKIFTTLKKNYHMIGLDALENFYYRKSNLKNTCHVTFDDGDISFYNNILPVIRKHKIPVSTYVSPLMAKEQKNFWFQEIRGYDENKLTEITKEVTANWNINLRPEGIKTFLKTLQIKVILEIIRVYQKETNTPPKPPMNMTVAQLREVKSSGLVDIGAHTLNHPVLPNETESNAKSEIDGSIDLLSEILNSEVSCFAYPNGNFGEREINILHQKGVKLAFTTQRSKISSEDSPLSIPRSGTPFISEFKNSNAYILSKCLIQIMAGENRYYKYADKWSTMASKVLKETKS
jgi:peptidoglycan/xylan/chitin deacetylase (PgdA/CDA1 family)